MIHEFLTSDNGRWEALSFHCCGQTHQDRTDTTGSDNTGDHRGVGVGTPVDRTDRHLSHGTTLVQRTGNLYCATVDAVAVAGHRGLAHEEEDTRPQVLDRRRVLGLLHEHPLFLWASMVLGWLQIQPARHADRSLCQVGTKDLPYTGLVSRLFRDFRCCRW